MALGLSIGAFSPAPAAGPGEAETLYQRGDMAAAASLARSLNSAEGFSLASKATLVQAAYLSPDTEKQALFELAAADARQALALEPDHVDAHLQLAIALGQLAELKNPISAHVGGYAEEGKALLDQALLLDPDNEWAQALLGMWHLRVVHHAGAALAGQLYGASRETGVGLCLQAIGGARSALALKYGCAAVLVELDFDQFEDTAERTLAAVKDAAARDAAENLVQAEATRLLDELKSGAFERSRRDARESELVP
ncbi:MAG TPA: hypothetical protein VE592_10505 [Geminicoccaceae bacterium]|nr:hypothetical protein [Geminicoccaceae bacterium]HZA67371.1 hypothetical protein [Geminicoccaceae bacterium]